MLWWVEPLGLSLSALAPLIVIVYNFINVPLPHRDREREQRLRKADQQIKSGEEVWPEDDSYDVFCELISEYENTDVHPSKFQIFHGSGFGGGKIGLHCSSQDDDEHKDEEYLGSKQLVSGWIESEIDEIQRDEERSVLLFAAIVLLIGFCLQLFAFFL